MQLRTSMVAVLLAATAGPATAGPRGAAEHAAITAYEGTKTCTACHDQEVKDFVTSLHYQHRGPTPFLANAQQGNNAGMMVSY